jgi:chemotaxis signal transduction protein
MAHDNTLTVTRTVGPLKLTPVDALTRFSPAKLPRGVLAAHGLSHLRYGVQVANMGVLVPSRVVSEVVDGQIVHAMPNAASWFPGLVNLRGNLIPVFDLRALTGAPTEEIKRLLVIDRGERAGAIPVDELPRPVDPQHRSAHLPPVPGEIQPHVRGAYLDDGQLWLDVDFAALFQALGARAGA